MYVGMELTFRTNDLEDVVFTEKNGRSDNFADENFYRDFLKCKNYTIHNITGSEGTRTYSCDLNVFRDITNHIHKETVGMIKKYGMLPDDFREDLFLHLLLNKKFILKDMHSGEETQATLISVMPIYAQENISE